MSDDINIGANDYGLEPTLIQLRCTIRFRGNSPPLMQWRESESTKNIRYGVSQLTVINTRTHCSTNSTLHLQADKITNGAKYVFELKESSTSNFSWSSPEIKLLGKLLQFIVFYFERC